MPSASDQRRGDKQGRETPPRQETKRRVSRVRPQNFPQYLNVDWGAPRRGIALVHVAQETTEPLGTLEHKGTSCKEVVPSSGVERQLRARCGKNGKKIPVDAVLVFHPGFFFFLTPGVLCFSAGNIRFPGSAQEDGCLSQSPPVSLLVPSTPHDWLLLTFRVKKF